MSAKADNRFEEDPEFIPGYIVHNVSQAAKRVKMRLSEFAKAKMEYRKRTAFALLLALVLIGFYCVLLLTHLGMATAYILHHFSPSIAGFVQGSLMFPIIFILLFTIWLFDRKASGDIRLRCPHCGRRVDDKSDIVIATKNCPYCGKIVLIQDT